MKNMKPNNILEMLRFQDGLALNIRSIDTNLEAIRQCIPKAADEIERLQKEVANLKAQLQPQSITAGPKPIKPEKMSARAEAFRYVQQADDFLNKAKRVMFCSKRNPPPL